MDATQAFGTHIVRALGVFLKEVEIDHSVYDEAPPHPWPEAHLAFIWNPEEAVPMLGSRQALSIPDGMSGSALWNTRYEEVTRQGRTWTPSDARVTGMVWGHSAKAAQIYATPIDLIRDSLHV